MTTNTTLHAGHDVRYLTSGQAHGGNAGAMRYYTASGEPPGRWAGKGAAALGLSGTVDGTVMDRLYMEHVGPGGSGWPGRGARRRTTTRRRRRSGGHPFASGDRGGRGGRGRGPRAVTVPYYDLTVSAGPRTSRGCAGGRHRPGLRCASS